MEKSMIVRKGFLLATHQLRKGSWCDWQTYMDTPEEALRAFLRKEAAPENWFHLERVILEAYWAYRDWYFYKRHRPTLTLTERLARKKEDEKWDDIPF